MTRLRAVCVLTALTTLSLFPAGSATAGADSCNDLTATMVGSPGSTMTGTDGPDVMITNGATEVRGNGGDDTICTTGTSHNVVGPAGGGVHIRVLGGAGDDLIDRRADFDTLATGLLAGEEGEDTILGAPGRDLFNTNDGERDVVLAGAGSDDGTTGGDPGPSADPDVIDLGAGDDGFSVDGPISPQLTVSGGEGLDGINFQLDKSRWSIDVPAGELRRDTTVAMSFDGFEGFHPSSKRGTVAFTGTAASERLSTFALLTDVRMGGGDDALWMLMPADAGPLRIDTGTGQDSLDVVSFGTNATLDLQRGRVKGDARRAGRVVGVENIGVEGDHVVLVGNSGPNILTWYGCRGGSVRGRGGDDTIVLPKIDRQNRHCPDKKVRLRAFGQGGDDLLIGWRHDDELVGGPGVDHANGKGGRDTCRGFESSVNCEVQH